MIVFYYIRKNTKPKLVKYQLTRLKKPIQNAFSQDIKPIMHQLASSTYALSQVSMDIPKSRSAICLSL